MGCEAGSCNKTSMPEGISIMTPSLEGWPNKAKEAPSPDEIIHMRVPVPFLRHPTLDPACPLFLKSLFPLPSFLFHPLFKLFQIVPSPTSCNPLLSLSGTPTFLTHN